MPKKKNARLMPVVTADEQKRLFRLLKKHSRTLRGCAGVNRVGIGYAYRDGKPTGEPAFVAVVEKKRPLRELAPKDRIPRRLGGIRTDVVDFRAKPIVSPTDKFDPLMGGIQINTELGTGTLGCIVFGGAGTPYGLTARHVLLPPVVPSVDPDIRGVWQPTISGTSNGIGRLQRADGATDSAIFSLDGGSLFDGTARRVRTSIFSGVTIESVGSLPPLLGMGVRKSGKTTGVTFGIVDYLDADGIDIKIAPDTTSMPASKPFADQGDSGSAVLEISTGRVVAVLKAVTAAGPLHGVASAIGPVLKALGCFVYDSSAGLWVSSPFWIGGFAGAFTIAEPFEHVTLSIVYPSGRRSSAKGLGTKQADASGIVRWSWVVGSSTKRHLSRGEALVTFEDGHTRMANFSLDGHSDDTG